MLAAMMAEKYHVRMVRTLNAIGGRIPPKLFIKGLCMSRTGKLLKKNRTITGFVTEHYKHLHSMEIISDTPFRKCTKQEETASYALCDCVALANFRHKILEIFLPKLYNYHHIPAVKIL